MPPHCDSMDGPVVRAAREALDRGEVKVILPYVHDAGEAEVRRAFDLVLAARAQGEAAREVADRYFFETAVRVHRAGEGAPFTGLKPAGLDVGPVIPLAEEAIGVGVPDRLVDFLADEVRTEATRRFDALLDAQRSAGDGVEAARRYVDAMLGLQVWAHKLHLATHAEAHQAEHAHA